MKLFGPFVEIFRLELRQAVNLKRIIWLSLFLLVPTFIIIVINLSGSKTDQRDFIGVGYFFFIQTLTPLISLIYGANMIAHEIDNKTLTYLLIRPVPKWLIILAKYLANVLVATGLIWIASLICLIMAILLNHNYHWENIVGIFIPFLLTNLVGAAVFTAIFNLMGLITRKPLLFGLAYCLLIEWLLSNLPMTLQNLSVSYYLRNLLVSNSFIRDIFIKEISPEWLGSVMTLTGVLFSLFIVLAVVLGISVFIFRRREFILSEEGN